MDFDIAGLEVDHRKRRRNRTTQSCLNCHTSKRKCDRKRPCQRCIQLGLTGLCVYEVDDPALRDDPNVDENTRLRNRIAELESLVRELRGKPHPKWAEPSFCDGDATEKWHSRSSRRLQYQKGPRADGGGRGDGDGRPPAIKTEQSADPAQHAAGLYRFSPSPPHDAHGSPTTPYALYSRHNGGGGAGSGGSVYSPTDDSCYAPSPSLAYGDARGGDGYYDHHGHAHAHGGGAHGYAAHPCACVTNPAAGNTLIGLTQQLQNTLALLRQLPEHGAPRQQAACAITRRVAELHDIMHSGNAPGASLGGAGAYEGLSTPTETELSMSPISTSSQSSIGAPPPIVHDSQAWAAAGAGAMPQQTGYDSYFPGVAAAQADHSVFHKTYHIN
ncbi:uncharacterized protein BXZ73DRAFT_50631 [Epithele typhae]|uniref:uncharacterized protein n=1 Tax=Epithele typhae TaxID=378194 RepID=UPI002008A9DF|nr:uncharacterized protein BXZ73DRAFT_50631 [Epithele typhae]KAH9924344.1 hypothetical protein BXZ73DRAFT_50631 [Epithele typhae]